MDKNLLLKLISEKPDSYVQILKAKHTEFYWQLDGRYVGEKFSEKVYRFIHEDNSSIGTCVSCKNPTKFTSFIVGFNKYCCKKCSNNATSSTRASKVKTTNLENRHEFYEKIKCVVCDSEFEALKYRKQKCCSGKCSGVLVASDPNRIKKSKQSKLEKYGDANYVNIEKQKQTLLEKYGVDNVFKHAPTMSDVHEKNRASMFKKMGDRIKKLSNCEFITEYKDYTSTATINKYFFKCLSCNTLFDDHINDGHLPRCTTCKPIIAGSSICENELASYVKSLVGDLDVITGDRDILGRKELDIYIPSKNIAIEYDGLYWHGENVGGKDKKYHITKTDECAAKNITLIHIFEDEWVNKKDIVKSKLKHLFGVNNDVKSIYARKCEIKEIDDCSDFLERNHIQGTVPSSIKIGAYFENTLVAVMTFGKLRVAMGNKNVKDGEFELLRFATENRVVGIASKLLQHFIKNYNPSKIITFADLRYSVGNLYNNIGFKLVGKTNPNYWYYLNGSIDRKHRFNFRKQELPKKLKAFDVNLTEWENMKNNGYDRIWDCGNLKYEWISPSV
jgi:hypothetical protein